jgi:hypothetical protein
MENFQIPSRLTGEPFGTASWEVIRDAPAAVALLRLVEQEPKLPQRRHVGASRLVLRKKVLNGAGK